ncbi:MAG: RnfABCDGE type electron transport complex subunit G [Gammaproteobacteria bacterium]|nr:RnfABCDGE type electron transport complex subunit G [Gammaproteobacteria bacterium]MCP5423924.1 RnfABCDGE type electron transport complex subunit G [Gammaproteobacteria bacterium]MCP5459403.1 RnfABCDGE type electron transport complex subunit G [Gammaproteobacteria bacterium]
MVAWIKPSSTVPYQTLLVGGVALLASAIISIGFQLTSGDIAKRQAEDRLVSLRQVLPSAPPGDELLRNPVTVKDEAGNDVVVYRVLKDGKVDGVAYQIIGQGYSGDIVLVIGVAPDGKLLGVRTVSHAETPGLGDKIETAKSDWVLGFAGRSLSDPPPEKWGVKKDGGVFDQFTGATITPRGVVKAVKQGLEFFDAHASEMLETSNSGASGGLHE